MFSVLGINCCKRRKVNKAAESCVYEPFPYADYSLFCKDFYLTEDIGISVPEEFELSVPHNRWDEICQRLPELIKSGGYREFIKKELAIIPTDTLSGFNALAASYTMLNKLTTAYLWCEEPSAQSLPEQLARPFFEVCQKLGMKPYNSYIEFFYNWKRIDRSKSIMDIENITNRYMWVGIEDERWTSLPGVASRLHFGPVWKGIFDANVSISSNNRENFNKALKEMLDRLTIWEWYPKKVFGKCFPEAFKTFGKYFGGTEDPAEFPNGVYYEGVDLIFRVPESSAIQDPSYQCFEKAMGIKYEGFLKESQLKARGGMPMRHVELINFLEKHSRIREYTKQDKESIELYNACLEAFSRYFFRHNSIIKAFVENFMEKGMTSHGHGTPNEKALSPEAQAKHEELHRYRTIKKRFEVILEFKL